MFTYRVYGMHVRSDLELPELSPGAAEGPFDLAIVVKDSGVTLAGQLSEFHYSPARQVFGYPGLGIFVINGVNEIVVEPAHEVSPGWLAFALLGPVMALLLHLRGHFALHASAVDLAGVGIGFMGDKGAGKSTTAAALLERPRTTLLSDDIVAFDDRGFIIPGFPQIKLAPDALANFSRMDARLRPPPVENFPKNQMRMAREAPEGKVKTGALYEIRRDTHMRIETLGPLEALKTLYRFSYVSRFTARPLEGEDQRRLFAQVGQIVNTVGVKRLYVPDTLERLPQVYDFLLDVHDRA